ncbi:unnamed protein product [Malus baccata var. baccata]
MSLALDDDDDDNGSHKQTGGRGRSRSSSKSRTPFLLFLPTKEIVTDTYRLATIARDMGMDLHPTPSLSHIILSFRPPPPSSSSSPSTSLSSTSLPDDAVPLPFPCLSAAPISHLRAFVKLKENPATDSRDRRVFGGRPVYLFRKVDTNRVRACAVGECRIRELRLPPLDFRNAPLRILHYILLMTDDIFYLA